MHEPSIMIDLLLTNLRFCLRACNNVSSQLLRNCIATPRANVFSFFLYVAVLRGRSQGQTAQYRLVPTRICRYCTFLLIYGSYQRPLQWPTRSPADILFLSLPHLYNMCINHVCLGMIYFEFEFEHSIFYRNENWFKTSLHGTVFLGKETLVFLFVFGLGITYGIFNRGYTKHTIKRVY